MYRQLIAAVFLCAFGNATAAVGPVPLEHLAQAAELIIYGRVDSLTKEIQDTEAGPGSEMHGHALYRINASISPIETIKGHAPECIIVTTLAGMEDHPVFQLDENAILFLVRDKDEGTFRTLALAQGKFNVADGQVVREGIPVEEFIDMIRDNLRPTSPALISALSKETRSLRLERNLTE